MKDPYKIILHPLQTEKGTKEKAQNKYLFNVAPSANKNEIRYAVEKVYKVNVSSVNTINMLGKNRRVRQALGKRPDWKKAIVTLKAGETIEDLGKQ